VPIQTSLKYFSPPSLFLIQHFTSQREEFEGTRESLLVWLTEIDLQLTNMEHFSEIHLQDKMKQLKVSQQCFIHSVNQSVDENK